MRALLSLILFVTLLLAACGGGGGDDDSPSGDTAGNEASTTAGSGDSGTEAEGADDTGDSQDGDGSGSANEGTGEAAASTTSPPLVAEPSRTPRPTSTPFPTATPLTMPPTATTQAGGVPVTETAPVPTVEVISSNVFRDPEAGSAIIFGEIQNTGDSPATGVQVSARLLDGAGNQVGRGESEAVGKTVVKPGDVVGFSVIVTFEDSVYTEWASQELSVDFEFSREAIVQAYTSDLAISGDTLVGPETGFDFVDVAGSLTNNSGKPLRFIQVGAIAYDASGNVISVDTFVTSDPVEPGATIPFAVEFSRGRLKEFPASYALVVEGLDASQ